MFFFLNTKRVQHTLSVICYAGQVARCMRSGRLRGPCSPCLATWSVRGASIANELSGLLWCSSRSPSRYRLRRQCWMTGGSTVVIEEVKLYRGALCCMPLRLRDVSACLIQELCALKMENIRSSVTCWLLSKLRGVVTREAVIFRQFPTAS